MILSIVIVSWNVGDLLEKCLASIYSNGFHGDLETIVVDNASSDGSAVRVAQQYPQVTLIANPRNNGFARANNQGMRQAAGDFVLLLNPDTVLWENALQILVNYMDEDQTAGAIGPMLSNPDGSLQYSCSPAPSLGREFRRLFHIPGERPDGYYPMETWAVNQPRQVEVLLGACLLLRKSVLEQVGLLDEDYYIYSEEVDLCHRIGKQGWRLVWVPSARVLHYGGQSTRQAAPEMFLNLYRGKLTYFRKHFGELAGFVYKLILMGAAVYRLVLWPLSGLVSQENKQIARHVASNYWRLLTALPGM